MIHNWIAKGLEPIPISVNLSYVHLRNQNFLESFYRIVKKYQVPPQLLEIELTETLVFENLDVLLSIIDKIHELGFMCALDDFGSGYSSLNTLKDINVDILKLDRAFFNSYQNQHSLRSEYVIQGIVELAQKLQMKTVAEGVEDMAQVEFLRSIHCDLVQGFVFAKPMPIADFEIITFPQK